jgi:hypothetical protein
VQQDDKRGGFFAGKGRDGGAGESGEIGHG